MLAWLLKLLPAPATGDDIEVGDVRNPVLVDWDADDQPQVGFTCKALSRELLL